MDISELTNLESSPALVKTAVPVLMTLEEKKYPAILTSTSSL